MELPNPAPAGKHWETAAPETSRRLAQSSIPDWARRPTQPRRLQDPSSFGFYESLLLGAFLRSFPHWPPPGLWPGSC